MDLETKILNVIPYTSLDKIFNLTLKFESDHTIFVQILEVSLSVKKIRAITFYDIAIRDHFRLYKKRYT